MIAVVRYRPTIDPRTVLLDLDGTLVDSAALITEHLAIRPPTMSKPDSLARHIAAGLGLMEFLTLAGGADEAADRSTKADVIASVVMVGDRHHDVDGAAAHRIPTIGVGWGYGLPDELIGAALVVPEIAALEAALLGPWAWMATPPLAVAAV